MPTDKFHGSLEIHSLIDPSPMLYPARRVSAVRIPMSPMQDTTFFVPFVFTTKANAVTRPQPHDLRCKIDIMGDE
jgi:hypothetical protein